MEYRNLGNSGLKASAIGLGTNTFSKRIDEQTSTAIINRALELGVNYLDTSDTYDHGGSEIIIGKALQGKRTDVILATKFAKPMGKGPNERGGSRYYIMREVEASLRRLQTDYIDLYQMHEPSAETPIEETLRALDDLIKAGKIRYIGTSNFAAWQICEARWTSEMNNLHSFITEQSQYNLLDRKIEEELVPLCQRYNIGIIPWAPLARGLLTGKYHKGEQGLSEWRLVKEVGKQGNLFSDDNWNKLARFGRCAADHGHTMGDLAIAWLLAKPWVATVIAGAREVEQVTANVAAGDWKMSPDLVSEVDTISRET